MLAVFLFEAWNFLWVYLNLLLFYIVALVFILWKMEDFDFIKCLTFFNKLNLIQPVT